MSEVIRRVDLDGYVLSVTDPGLPSRGLHYPLGYTFVAPDGATIFDEHDTFGCSPLHATDSDATLRNIIAFITLRPGDTDADYFADYSPAQLAFAEGDAEQLLMWAVEEMEPVFVDLPIEGCE